MAKRNILLMIADDLGKQLGCYGNSKIQTPHLDQLARDGTRFDQAFTSTASCSASRSVIYTGLHTHQNGQYGLHNGRHHFTTFDHVETAPALFSQHGYLTGLIGKVHVGPSSVYPWETCAESDSRNVANVADQASAFFKRSVCEESPFFLTIGFIDPHRDLTRSGFGNNSQYDPRVKQIDYSPEGIAVEPFVNDLPGVRFEFAEYYRSISRLDQGVGMVLEELEKNDLAEDTLVIFMSDNGPPFINSKTTLYDAGICLPLLIKCPGSEAGIANPNMVSYIDILPTLLDWANHPSPEHPARLGRSLLPILSQSSQIDFWDQVFGSHTFHEITNYWPTRFMRNRRFKYHRNIAWRLDFPFAADIYGSLAWEDIRNSDISPKMIGKRPLKNYFFRPPEELYDIQADPHEVCNLVNNPEYGPVLDEMRLAVEQWQRRTEDPWLFRDGVSMLLVRQHLAAGLEVPDRFDFNEREPESKGQVIFDSKLAWGPAVDSGLVE
ncbi:Alkaline phosphatase-like alpha/beta/alpha [Penicillium macrosclerotiorum]|uniref:Alkaline phosphatase-like alpha/beta/alpha n=1 Tax=Penicillium macrosclerotiorum TaxID=303699 RepID=UPI00254916E9|nr:Alkaline phosphatase-like alpha/beta/alpha [Penicillium macrosclerotiorum]KAJ5683605.1 Alkaline phosphatase-like alpha/beta/alpha [Penicillium macrosclerotiorum]